jgi:hypothetical protein
MADGDIIGPVIGAAVGLMAINALTGGKMFGNKQRAPARAQKTKVVYRTRAKVIKKKKKKGSFF